jgi:hypothetical protein
VSMLRISRNLGSSSIHPGPKFYGESWNFNS